MIPPLTQIYHFNGRHSDDVMIMVVMTTTIMMMMVVVMTTTMMMVVRMVMTMLSLCRCQMTQLMPKYTTVELFYKKNLLFPLSTLCSDTLELFIGPR